MSSRRVLVTWQAPSTGRVTTPVTLTEGYTDESHITRILAIAYLGGVEDASTVDVLSVREGL